MTRFLPKIHIATVGLVVFLASAVTAAAPSTGPQAQADQLIQQLGSQDAQTRQKAQQELIDLGVPVRPAVQAAIQNGLSPEARLRAQAILKAIDRNDTTVPTFITLQYKNTSLGAIIGDLADQSGLDMDLWPPNQPLPSISIDISHQPFWTALNQLCEKGHLSVMDGWGKPGYMRLQVHGGENPVHIGRFIQQNGPFMIMLTGMQRSYNKDFTYPGAGQGNAQFSISLSVLIDPKIQLLGRSHNAVLTEATDNKGNSLLASHYYSSISRGFGNDGLQLSLSAQLKYPLHPGNKIVRLKGKLPVILARHTTTVEIPNPLKIPNITKTIGRYQFTMKDFKKTPGSGYTWDVILKDTHSSFFRLPTGKTFEPPVSYTFFDADGHSLANGSISEGRMSGNMGLNGTAEPAKLVLKVATKWEQRDITFEFKDVPMP